MNAFAAMFAALHADPNVSADAFYTPAAGAAVACRVVWSSGDRDVGVWDTGGVTTPARIAEVLSSAVATAAEGDTLTVGGAVYRITKATQPNSDRLTWRLELAP